MKNIVYILSILLFWGCQKEDELTPSIKYEHLYGIVSNSTDSVEQRVYEIYQKYGVPVYFNDTIGKVFVKQDIYGDSVFNYETLDLAWSFTNNSKIQYRYEYMENQSERMNTLNLIEKYLELCPKALYPFNFFVVKSAATIDGAGNASAYDGKYGIFMRTLMLVNGSDLTDELPQQLRMAMIKNKISNYPTELELFNSVSQSSWYYMLWNSLDPNFYEYCAYPYSWDLFQTYNGYMGIAIQNNWMTSSTIFDDNWNKAYIYPHYLWEFYTAEGLAKFRAMVREKIGAWGFIAPGTFTPQTPEADQNSYLNEMLKISKEEFEARWGNCPLVMEKYNILYDIVANKFGVEL